MSGKGKGGHQGGGSSQPNGPNERANDAAKSVGLNKDQQEQLQRQLESEGKNLTFKEIQEMAKDIKKGN